MSQYDYRLRTTEKKSPFGELLEMLGYLALIFAPFVIAITLGFVMTYVATGVLSEKLAEGQATSELAMSSLMRATFFALVVIAGFAGSGMTRYLDDRYGTSDEMSDIRGWLIAGLTITSVASLTVAVSGNAMVCVAAASISFAVLSTSFWLDRMLS